MLPRLRPTDESCSAIFSGNDTAITRAKETDFRDPVDLLAVTKNCKEFKRSRGYMTECTSAEEERYPIAYSVLMYKDPEQVCLHYSSPVCQSGLSISLLARATSVRLSVCPSVRLSVCPSACIRVFENIKQQMIVFAYSLIGSSS